MRSSWATYTFHSEPSKKKTTFKLIGGVVLDNDC